MSKKKKNITIVGHNSIKRYMLEIFQFKFCNLKFNGFKSSQQSKFSYKQ